MGVAKPPPVCSSSSRKTTVFSSAKIHQIPILHHHHDPTQTHKPGSMSGQQQDYHHHPQQGNLFAFPNGFDRSSPGLTHQDQIRRDTTKLRPGFDPSPPTSTLVAIDHNPPTPVDPSSAGLHPVYETAGMLSEMFNNFGHGPGPATSPEILDYRRAVSGLGSDWYGGNRQVARDNIGDHQQQHSDHHQHHQIPSINADSAAAMQLFLTNPPPRSPSPPQQPPPGSANSNSTLHMLLPSPSTIPPGGGGFHSISGLHHHPSPSPNTNFWTAHINNPSELGGIVEGQGLSLSLSSSLQHLEASKQPDDLRNIATAGDTHIMFFNQHNSSSTNTSSPAHFFNLQQQQSMIQANLQAVGGAFGSGPGPSTTAQHQVHLGFGSASTSSSLGVVNVLRNSKYAKPAQELLEEFCSVGRGHLKKSKLSRQNSVNPTLTTSGGGGGGGCGGAGSSSSSKDPPQLSPADRIEHQRRKVKLLSMLDEVDRRYNNYCEQMQMVVNSFDLVMGYGAATPYTALAQKAMSRHFRCLKEAIQAQLRQSCELLGEKDPTATSGLTKGETPRLKMLEQSLRQQRAFHQMGLMEQEAWRPQRGLPERSVNVLRAWLFEHFLHPYPNDADKHMLARQTGLSRNQVSNWFINARVRLWKPMVEEMYQQESKELEEEAETDVNQTSSSTSNTNTNTNTFVPTQNPMPCSSSSVAAISDAKRSAETMTPPDQSDPSSLPAINRHHHQPPPPPTAFVGGSAPPLDNANVGPTTMIRFGTAAGDVSLTLGLRHAGNAPEKSAAFSVRDFGSC